MQVFIYTDLMSAINWHSIFLLAIFNSLIQLHSLLELQTLRINMTSTINKNRSNSKQNKKATLVIT